MHGYELRKRVTGLLGWSRVLSYGSLYPCLKQLVLDGLITEDIPEPAVPGPSNAAQGSQPTRATQTTQAAQRAIAATASAAAGVRGGRRGKIVYKVTAAGKQRFDDLVSAAGPSAWEDESFGIRFAFFGSTSRETRLRILEGRRSRLEERLDTVRTSFARSRERVDTYALELQRHGLELVEREVRWLTELIDSERAGSRDSTGGKVPTATPTPSNQPADGTPSGIVHPE